MDLKKYVIDKIGELILKDIISELEKLGWDFRVEFKYVIFKEGIKEIRDLEVGMELEGIVINVVNFGVFVDVGVY